MIKGMLGRKVGMSQLFKEDGEVIPVTLIQAGPCYVIQKKTLDRDGYVAVQIGFDSKKEKHLSNPLKGHFDKVGKGYFKILKEVECDNLEELNEGDEITIENLFQPGEHINISGISKGKGYQGVVRRHGFAGNPASHGSKIHRSTGSVGCSADPSKIIKGKKLPGQMGNKKVTVSNLEIVDIKKEDNLIAVKGAVPGARGQVILLKKQGE